MKLRSWLVSGAAHALLLLTLTANPQAVTLNSRGQAAMGVGGGVASIDGDVIARGAGGTAWVTDNVVIYQVCEDSCRLEVFDQTTHAKMTVDTRGANFVTAGGGRWAAWLGTNPATGIFSNFGFTAPEAGLQSLGPDGSFAYKPLYQSNGPTVLLNRDGSTVKLTDGAAYDVQVLGAGRAIWREGFTVRTLGIPTPVTLDPSRGIWRPRVADINGELWVAYYSGLRGDLVLHPFTSTRGYVIDHSEFAFAHDVIGLAHQALVAFARNEAESPDSLVKVVVDTANAPRVELSTPTPEPRPEPVPTPEPQLPALPDAVCESLKTQRAKYGATMTNAQIGPMLNAAVFPFKSQGFGLSGKKAGNNCSSPAGLIACDIVQKGLVMWDVYVGAGEQTAVNCGTAIGEQTDPQARPFVAPVDPGTGPVDPGPDPQVEELKRRLADVTAQLNQALAQRDQARARVTELEQERDDLKAQIEALSVALDLARQETAAVQQKLNGVGCESKVPGFLRALGIRVGCVVTGR